MSFISSRFLKFLFFRRILYFRCFYHSFSRHHPLFVTCFLSFYIFCLTSIIIRRVLYINNINSSWQAYFMDGEHAWKHFGITMIVKMYVASRYENFARKTYFRKKIRDYFLCVIRLRFCAIITNIIKITSFWWHSISNMLKSIQSMTFWIIYTGIYAILFTDQNHKNFQCFYYPYI